ncbi:ethanolamine ammonia-lyase reactivating factor EutA [Streptomyces sp. NBC_01498]|uniref:ethanolamine ammonia-lyase reactivating factor EutA n=1 Tax=Streptomyces sp. NBC_01498 TaxID=2975870 RepID=UPI002E7B0DB2|nr:ethanolamine ammonia-lyase reactivating factor EutA [Streptomyces sp. NBC_01498]WTL27994.1 ethanolamine ammonia-lyase reactivating factor EutA [Streptomyces sp. NBC_01498]
MTDTTATDPARQPRTPDREHTSAHEHEHAPERVHAPDHEHTSAHEHDHAPDHDHDHVDHDVHAPGHDHVHAPGHHRDDGHHGHDGHDHDHDHGVSIWPEDPDHPLWERDQIVLTSVGVDIGSATSQLLFSRLTLRRLGRELSSAYAVVDKQIVHESAVVLTPYAEGLTIDGEALGTIVEEAFAAAGVSADDVDTGAVILTGEATRRHNARALADLFASRTGRFICATAGHGMEATLAAHGSGAVARSERGHARVLNIDMGGGTTKLSVAESGTVRSTAALHLGARLIVVDGDGRIVRLEPAGRRLAAALGHDWSLGDRTTPGELAALAELMADAVLAEVTALPGTGGSSERIHAGALSLAGLRLTDPLTEHGPYDAVLFSGGVAEYVHGRESRDFGDLGPFLGRALAARTGRLPGPVENGGRAIRATVLGASQYTVQVSGNTIHIGDPALLPLHNLRVVRPEVELGETVDADRVAEAITRHLARIDMEPEDPLVFGFRWTGLPSFPRLDAFVRGVRRGLGDRIAAGLPLCLLFEGDIARSVGALLLDQGVTVPVVSVDGISVTELDHVDIGAVLAKSGTVPVSLKSLVFSL